MNIRPKYVAAVAFSCARQRYAPGDPVDHPAVLDAVLPFGDRFVINTAHRAADTDVPVEPPRAGPGSGVAAWREYAAALDLDVADDATRDDIIAAVDAAPSDGTPPEDHTTPPETSSAPEVTS